jgi:hypothetical protein
LDPEQIEDIKDLSDNIKEILTDGSFVTEDMIDLGL